MIKLIRAILLMIWIAYLASFLLPATSVAVSAGAKPGTPLTGYQAFYLFVEGGWHPFVVLPFPRLIFLFPCIVFANFVMVLLPAAGALARHSATVGIVAGVVVILGAIAAWQLPQELKDQVFIGYFLWIFSMMVGGIVTILLSLTENLFGSKI